MLFQVTKYSKSHSNPFSRFGDKWEQTLKNFHVYNIIVTLYILKKIHFDIIYSQQCFKFCRWLYPKLRFGRELRVNFPASFYTHEPEWGLDYQDLYLSDVLTPIRQIGTYYLEQLTWEIGSFLYLECGFGKPLFVQVFSHYPYQRLIL